MFVEVLILFTVRHTTVQHNRERSTVRHFSEMKSTVCRIPHGNITSTYASTTINALSASATASVTGSGVGVGDKVGVGT